MLLILTRILVDSINIFNFLVFFFYPIELGWPESLN